MANKKGIRALSYLFILTYSIFSLSSCKKKDVPIEPPSAYDYFPTLVGHWVVYDVDSTVYLNDGGAISDSTVIYQFQIKELLSSTFIDGEGRPTQVLQRFHRANDSADWVLTEVWSETLTSSRAERVEDNIRYIPLAFPITSEITWNGNAFNELGEQDYSYEDFHQPLSLNGLSFDSTLSVLQTSPDDINFVQTLYGEEKYAVHVGRISKIYQNILMNSGLIVSGLDYRETVNSFGNN